MSISERRRDLKRRRQRKEKRGKAKTKLLERVARREPRLPAAQQEKADREPDG